MLSSPPKRRKSSAPTARADASQINPPPLRPNPDRRSTDRASYQSPTRASLARSHPEILQRALSRSPARNPQPGQNAAQQDQPEARVFGLRDRKALRPSLTMAESPIDPFKKALMSPANRRSSGVQAFAAPPRRVSRRIVPSDLTFQSPVAAKQTIADPAVTNTPEDQLASELGSATGGMDLQDDFDQPVLNDDFEEPDLPPTPTQLGLEKPPGRPASIASSSPTAKRSRLGKRQVDMLQSPSKLRSVEYSADTEDRSESTEGSGKTLFPEPVLKKRKLKKQLSAEIEQLQGEISELERWSGDLDQRGDIPERDLSKLVSLLVSQDSDSTSTKRQSTNVPMSSLISALLPFSTKVVPKAPEESLPTNTFALDESAHAEPYLTAFGPLNLTAHSTTTTNAKTKTVLERHDLTLSAPSPFPTKLYSVPVTYETNPETQSMVSITVLGLDSKMPECLRRWINSRLENPLMRLDVSGLCWGINRYWEASISRARMWSRIEERQAGLIKGSRNSNGNQTPARNTETLTRGDLRRILPHFERSSMLFESKAKGLRLILSCELTIDEWASEPRLVPGITVSLPARINGTNGKKIEQESKRLFHAILSENQSESSGRVDGVDGDAILRAAEGVLGILFGPEQMA